MSKYGPNVTKLITKFIAREAVPPGGGLASALDFFANAEQRKKVLDAAEAKAIQAIQLIKSAPDNQFGEDDEKIASEILFQIQERQLTMRAADVLPCGHNQGIVFGEASWTCAVCGQPARRKR